MNVCARHREHPARIYGECIGCELEWLQEKIRALEESGEEDFRLSEAQSAALVELKRKCKVMQAGLEQIIEMKGIIGGAHSMPEVAIRTLKEAGV